jgi:tRNA (cytidine/uridine-2'-O-)-methyltransferase
VDIIETAAFSQRSASAMRLALFEPDIPQNCGTILRLCACLGVPVDIVEPCGFLWHDRRLRRAGLDYLAAVDLSRHESWTAFERARRGRLLLLTTKAERCYLDFGFDPGDVILLGRESAGVPDTVHSTAAARLKIPMRPGQRSINVALAASMVLGEALRQTRGFPLMSVDRHGG